MRIRRAPYIIVFLVAGLLAGGVYLFAQPRTELVRATVDVPVLTQITADMVETIRVSPADAPSDAARSADEVVGRYAALPILAGQTVDVRALERTPGERALGFGAPLARARSPSRCRSTRRRRSAGRWRPGPGSTSSRCRTRSRPGSRPALARAPPTTQVSSARATSSLPCGPRTASRSTAVRRRGRHGAARASQARQRRHRHPGGARGGVCRRQPPRSTFYLALSQPGTSQ